MKKIICLLLFIFLFFDCDFFTYYNEDEFETERLKFSSLLSFLEISNDKIDYYEYPSLTPKRYNYNYTVRLSTTSVKITLKSVDRDASISINGIASGNGKISSTFQFSSDNINLNIEVASSKGNNTTDYTINILKSIEETYYWNKKISNNNRYDSGWDAESANSIAVDSNNNVYVVGHGVNIVTSTSGFDWVIKKFDNNGKEDTANWNKKINNNSYDNYPDDSANSIAIDSNNNVYVVGHGHNLVSGTSVFDWWIKKFESNGNEDTTNWNKKYSSYDGSIHANLNESVNSLAIDSNNNVYVAGYGYNLVSGTSGYDWWIKKFDSSGDEYIANWDKKFDGGSNAQANSIAIDSNNDVYVAGLSGSGWLIKKFDSNGIEDTENWNKSISSGSANSIAIDSNNNVFIAGYENDLVSGSSGSDWRIKKFDSNGIEDNENWNKKYSSYNGTYYSESANSIAIDSNNNVYVVGYGLNLVSSTSKYDWWIKKFDSNGNEDTTNWNIKYTSDESFFGQKESANSIAIDSNNYVYIAGCGLNLVTFNSSYDWWIKKFIED